MIKSPLLHVIGFLLLQIISTPLVFAEFTYVATHPEARTVFPGMKIIREMIPFNNRLYLGYGANGAEIGTTEDGSSTCASDDTYWGIYCDMKLRYLDLESGLMSDTVIELRSQGMFSMDVHAGHLYVLAEDPDVLKNADPAEMGIRCDSSNCAKFSFPDFINSNGNLRQGSAHNYVSAEFQNAIYIGGGHGSGSGGIWKSVDNGETWEEEILIPKNNDIPCCARISFMAVLDGSLYAQAFQYDGYIAIADDGTEETVIENWRPQNTVYKLSGGNTEWENFSSKILTGSEGRLYSKLFLDKIISLPRKTSPYAKMLLKAFDGFKTEVVIDEVVRDFFISGRYLYALKNNGEVLQTKDLTNWEIVEDFSSYIDIFEFNKGRQIAIHNNTLYVGDKGGHIWVSDKKFPVLPANNQPIYNYILKNN